MVTDAQALAVAASLGEPWQGIALYIYGRAPTRGFRGFMSLPVLSPIVVNWASEVDPVYIQQHSAVSCVVVFTRL